MKHLPSAARQTQIRERFSAQPGISIAQLAREFGEGELVQVGHHSITLGTRNRPRSTAGALCWLASR